MSELHKYIHKILCYLPEYEHIDLEFYSYRYNPTDRILHRQQDNMTWNIKSISLKNYHGFIRQVMNYKFNEELESILNEIKIL